MNTQALDHVLPQPLAARRAFDRAAASIADAGVLQARARETLIERLVYARLDPRLIVDLGTGSGAAFAALSARYPDARIIGIDSSRQMCVAATAAGPPIVCADARALPVASASVDLLFASFVLPWSRPDEFFAEAARVLSPDGLLLFSTLGPDTLAELRRAWSAHDDHMHVHALVDMHDLGDLALAGGLTEPVLDVERLRLSYASTAALVRDLRDCGAVNTAGGRRRSLTGRRRWAAFEASFGEIAGDGSGRLEVGVELIYGQAWGNARTRLAAPGPGEAGGETAVPVSSIGRR